MDAFIFLCLLLLVIVFIMAKEYFSNRQFHRKRLEQIFADYGKAPERQYKTDELSHICMYYQKHTQPDQVDDITWRDLHMDEVYKRLNTCLSSAGDEYLYYRLRTPAGKLDALSGMERHIRFFMEEEKERHRLQEIFYALGRTGRHSLYEYLDQLETLGERKNTKYIFFDALLLFCAGLMFVSLPVGLVGLFAVLCHNIITYFQEYRPIEPYITSFAYVRRLLQGAALLGKEEIGEIAEELAQVRLSCQKLKGFLHSSSLTASPNMGSGNPLEILVDYLRMFLYLDLIRFNRALYALRSHMEEVDRLVTVFGQLECVIAAGAYRKSLGEAYCTPVLRESAGEALFLDADGLCHPLLQEPVANSLHTRKGVLLTGSNASGKSTFLRAVAVNALLAQTIHTCAAASYSAPLFRIYSSMSLQDDLAGGDSYYMVEIKSIKRILDQAGQVGKRPVLCFVDEVLRGTNTVERIAASTQIMKMLAAREALCFAATHDVELTKLLAESYDNYHFEERMAENDIFFPYQLLKGPAETRNAIALLRLLGYDEEITAEAEKMAERFLQEGSWR